MEYITAGVILFIIGLILYWAIKIICDKKTTDYFNSSIKDKLQSMFNGHKYEIIEHLDDLKGLKEFKDSKILILNDSKNTLQNLTFFANFTNKVVVNSASEKLDKADISIAIIFANNDNDMQIYQNYLQNLDSAIPILIYTKERLNFDFLKDKLYVPVNTHFTLLERLHTAYMIKKIMEK